jgi:hypothetical protein
LPPPHLVRLPLLAKVVRPPALALPRPPAAVVELPPLVLALQLQAEALLLLPALLPPPLEVRVAVQLAQGAVLQRPVVVPQLLRALLLLRLATSRTITTGHTTTTMSLSITTTLGRITTAIEQFSHYQLSAFTYYVNETTRIRYEQVFLELWRRIQTSSSNQFRPWDPLPETNLSRISRTVQL